MCVTTAQIVGESNANTGFVVGFTVAVLVSV